MDRLKDKRAIITGATTGIGLAAARLFAAEGARVAITGADAGRVAAAVEQLGGDIPWAVADLRRAESVREAMARLADALGGVDVLFLNAGITQIGPLDGVTDQDIDDQLALHVKAPLLAVQAVAGRLSDGASVIMTTSVLGGMGMPGMAAYSASKAGQRSLVRTLAAELAGRNVRVNAISPGAIETPIYGKLGLDGRALQEMAGQIVAQVPMGRFGRPEEIAEAALFLAASDSSYMTGQELVLDGGWSGV